MFFSAIIFYHFIVKRNLWAIKTERFTTYNLSTLFVVRPHDKTSDSKLRPILVQVLITSICASPCPSFSRNSGRTFRRNPREDRKVEPRGRDQEEHEIQVRVPFIRLSFLGSSRGRVFHLPVPVSHSFHSRPCAIAFPDSSENRYNA